MVFSKLRQVLTERIVRWLVEKMKKDREGYSDFHAAYSMFWREGIVTEEDFGVKVCYLSCSNIKRLVIGANCATIVVPNF